MIKVGAISIIRVSGSEALEIVNNILKGKNLKKVESHTINYGYIFDGEELIDEVLVSIFLAPKTYTKEDVVDRYGKYGVITTIWNVDIEHKRCDYLRRDDNTRCAADFNYITNMNNIINWAIKTHEPKH